MVNRITGVSVLDDFAEVTVCIADWVAEQIKSSRTRSASSAAWGETCWYKLLEPIADQWRDVRVPVDFLEVTDVMVSHVTDFGCDLAAHLPLNSKVPLFGIGIAEVGAEL